MPQDQADSTTRWLSQGSPEPSLLPNQHLPQQGFLRSLAPSHLAPPAACRCPRPSDPLWQAKTPVSTKAQETGSSTISSAQAPYASPLPYLPVQQAQDATMAPGSGQAPANPRPPAHPRRVDSSSHVLPPGGSARPHTCQLSRSRVSCMDQVHLHGGLQQMPATQTTSYVCQ